MGPQELLVFVPTYNERENVLPLYLRLRALNLPLHILFLDDGSPDGTGLVMDEVALKDTRVHVIHREGKLGIGSAHKVGIRWAFENGFKTLITMDADFTHPPENIPALVSAAEQSDIVVASRYLKKNSLEGWNPIRKLLTWFAHFLTTNLLGLVYDSTGAFRLYQLKQLDKAFLERIDSNGYSFFFESLFTLSRMGYKITEIPISLPPRTYGSSKMSYVEIYKSVRQLFVLYFRSMQNGKGKA